MKGIILATGYATRLYPLTKIMPKSFLPIAKVPDIERLLLKFNGLNNIDQIFFVINSKFYPHFEKWLKDYYNNQKITSKLQLTMMELSRMKHGFDLSVILHLFWKDLTFRKAQLY